MKKATADITDQRLREALRNAHMPTLLMALVQLTGDEKWLTDRYAPARPVGGNDADDGGFSDSIRDEIIDAAFSAVIGWQAGQLQPPQIDEATLRRMMEHSTGDKVDPASITMNAEELGIIDRDQVWRQREVSVGSKRPSVLIVGAGLSGICMAIKLQRENIPYVIIERGSDVGGTWNTNRYPASGVDSPSHLYEYSFERYPDWPAYFSKRADIQAYFSRVADRYGVRQNVRFQTHVVRAEWNDSTTQWLVHLEGSEGCSAIAADVIISAVGLLNRPITPKIAGAESFQGIAQHTSNWDPAIDLTGKRVAVIGTGASAMQFVPAVADYVAQLTVFQRTPQWFMPLHNYTREVSDEKRYLLRHVPFYAAWYRYRQFWAWNDRAHPTLQIDPEWSHPERSVNRTNDRVRAHLTRHYEKVLVDRPDLLESCLPKYPPFGKRMLMDNGWLETLLKDNIRLVDEGIERILPTGVLTASGREVTVDVIAYATGFDAHRVLFPIEVIGRDGFDLQQEWGDCNPRAYLGISIPKVPNFFCIFGPNTALGHGGSIIFHTELQVRYVMSVLTKMIDRDLASVEVRKDIHDAYNERVDQAHSQMIWSYQGMSTWYRNDKGRVVSLSPWKLSDYWAMTREADLTAYRLRSRSTG